MILALLVIIALIIMGAFIHAIIRNWEVIDPRQRGWSLALYLYVFFVLVAVAVH